MSEYYASLPADIKKTYYTKITSISGKDEEFDPFTNNGKWIDDVTKWPEVEFGQIYCYLIDSPGEFTRETLQAYKSLDAYKYFHSGWVHTCYYHELDGGKKCIIKAKINRSQALSEKPHEAWVCLSKKQASVVAAHCTCMAG